ncbi:hypothetical protein [Rugosimonospora africana]|uniref:hypothetical protein n=1 Tax=Rugosimonospora africana TaxID=556532 RepID=UPI0019451843|nr:hypothetical protein [Rugosimonospora africana]
MTNPRAGKSNVQSGHEDPPKLPIRWAVILLAAGFTAYLGHRYAGPIQAGTAAIAVTTLLHTILP